MNVEATFGKMAVLKKNTEPSKIPLYIWFLEVFIVLIFCCVVIRLCFIPIPPTYTLTSVSIPGMQESSNEFSVHEREEIRKNNATIIFSLLITNVNKAKDIVYEEAKITLYKNESMVGVRALPSFFQRRKSKKSISVLVNINQQRMKQRGRVESVSLKVVLETKVRYIILGWTTKRHFLHLEASMPFDANGRLSIGDDGIKLKPVKRKP